MSTPQTIAAALDCARFDAIAELAELASSYWHSIALAADRGERLTVEAHCRQVAAVNCRNAFDAVGWIRYSPSAGRRRHHRPARKALGASSNGSAGRSDSVSF
jgi:hypothetical protein